MYKMNLENAAAALGIDLSDVQEDTIVHKEKRYHIIIHVLRGKHTFIGSNLVASKDIKIAKREAIKNLKTQLDKVKKNDLVSVKALEVTYADVPIDTVLKGPTLSMQPITNRWLSPEELLIIKK
jgi:hypothetical protein